MVPGEMESELKDLSKTPTPLDSPPPPPSSSKDEVPLLPPSRDRDRDLDLDGKYAPFVRRDAYGTMGRGPLPLREKLLLALAAVTLVPLRLALALLILLLYYLICRFCTAFSPLHCPDDDQEDYAHLSGWRRAVIVRCGRFLSRALLFTVGFYWIHETSRTPSSLVKDTDDGNASKEAPEESKLPGAIISNHISYLDILYHMSSSFPSFVAKRSVARLSLVGLISKCLGCVYVQRESKSSDFKGVSGVVTERVQSAHQNKMAPKMMLFPEGTTTNGDFLLPFKTGAFVSKAPVLPVILKYPHQRFSPAWDSISGARHVILLLSQFVNHMEVIRLPVYCPSQQEKEDPKFYANNVRKLMANEGNLMLSEIGLAEKRVYHAALNGNSLPSVLHPKDD